VADRQTAIEAAQDGNLRLHVMAAVTIRRNLQRHTLLQIASSVTPVATPSVSSRSSSGTE